MNCDKKSKFRTIIILCLIRFFDALGFGALIPLAPLLAISFGTDVATSTWVTSIFPLFFLISAPFIGKFSDKYGRRRPILICLLIGFVGYGLMAAVPSLMALLGSRALVGLAAASAIPAGAALADISDVTDRGKLLSLRQASFTLGVFTGPLFVVVFIADQPLLLFPVMAAISALTFFLALLLPETMPSIDASALDDADLESPRAASRLNSSSQALLFISFLQYLAFTLIYSALPLILVRAFFGTGLLDAAIDHPQALTLIGLVSAVSTASMLVVQIVIAPRVSAGANPAVWMMAILGIWTANILLTPWMLQLGLAYYLPSVVVSGAMAGLFLPLATTRLSLSVSPHAQASVFALLEVALGLAAILAPIAAGPIAALGIAQIYWTAGVIMLAAAVLCFSFVRGEVADA